MNAPLTMSYGDRWRARARDRINPPPTEWVALWLSLDAVCEAVIDGRPFSWACSQRQKIAAQDWCISRALRRQA